jgi:hypothetical protein
MRIQFLLSHAHTFVQEKNMTTIFLIYLRTLSLNLLTCNSVVFKRIRNGAPIKNHITHNTQSHNP